MNRVERLRRDSTIFLRERRKCFQIRLVRLLHHSTELFHLCRCRLLLRHLSQTNQSEIEFTCKLDEILLVGSESAGLGAQKQG